MLTISQHEKTGHHRHEQIIQVRQGKYHFSSLGVLTPQLRIQGCSFEPNALPPGLLLCRHRDRFDVFGVAIHRGDWGGLLCVDTEHTLIQRRLIFVVR